MNLRWTRGILFAFALGTCSSFFIGFSFAQAGKSKTHSWFHTTGKWNCPALVYYTSMSTSSSTTSDSCENVFFLLQNDREELKRFVAANYTLIEEQVSQGRGELLADYAAIMHCPHAPGEFAKSLRENFDDIFSRNRSPDRLIQKSQNILKANPDLARKCTSGA